MSGAGCVAYGDCNTEGVDGYAGALWAGLVADAWGLRLTNCGHTMSTTRELRRYAEFFPPANYSLALIQYGLVDAWLTFRGAPYVLYYPDNPWRRFLRKWVKKIKKRARRFRLHERLGSVEQVPLPEYLAHIRQVVTSAPDTLFVLVATAPNRDESRNPHIRRYNAALETLARELDNAVYADAYEAIWAQRDRTLMADGTHLTEAGHRLLADRVIRALRQRQQAA
ncbi:SGNH/GDSL hydrolase family protein [Marinobacter sp. JSM 1782161]|uniref:SGNH/GDSL hydrolase family protein n=1 Tax=Marinobacter sp. JSM 1782161 TaxID=2685906 RepID=UPI00140276DD|nr:SGNH/GDSL hydrolase family protein [Marinobacter sp. JSM 1782161]